MSPNLVCRYEAIIGLPIVPSTDGVVFGASSAAVGCALALVHDVFSISMADAIPKGMESPETAD
jgi:hypothetical protein